MRLIRNDDKIRMNWKITHGFNRCTCSCLALNYKQTCASVYIKAGIVCTCFVWISFFHIVYSNLVTAETIGWLRISFLSTELRIAFKTRSAIVFRGAKIVFFFIVAFIVIDANFTYHITFIEVAGTWMQCNEGGQKNASDCIDFVMRNYYDRCKHASEMVGR